MDLIAAIATGSAATAIGIIRLSGDGCFAACDRVFRPRNGRPFADQPSHKMVFGEMLDETGAVIDQGLAVRFGGGHSYTGEDSAEFYCHGSPVVLRELLSALFAAGARQAGPGEFTRRAFLNGRLDLTEAEAVVDLIDAETAAAARNAAAQLHGALRRDFEAVTERLLDITSRFYAVVDYPDEDIQDIQPQEIRQALRDCDATLSRLLDTCGRGRILKSGVRTAIIGRPNAGKSSLLNALAGYERCLVTDIPGTTRDTVEERAELGGVTLRLIDTAGLRDSDDPIEQLGVERSRAAMDEAALVLLVVDGTEKATREDADLARAIAGTGKPWILVRSKGDIAGENADDLAALAEGAPLVSLSARTGEGLDDLGRAVEELFPKGTEDKAGELITNARQAEAAGRALDCVVRAGQALTDGVTPDALLTDVEEALEALGELTGQSVREDVTDRIFSKFCVGK